MLHWNDKDFLMERTRARRSHPILPSSKHMPNIPCIFIRTMRLPNHFPLAILSIQMHLPQARPILRHPAKRNHEISWLPHLFLFRSCHNPRRGAPLTICRRPTPHLPRPRPPILTERSFVVSAWTNNKHWVTIVRIREIPRPRQHRIIVVLIALTWRA